MIRALLLIGLGILPAAAQPVLTPSNPVPITSPVLGSLGAGPALEVSGGMAGATNVPAGLTNLTVGEISTAIVNLQAAIEQAWPTVAAFNENFDFSTMPPQQFSGSFAGNFSRNLGANFGANFGQNFAQNLAVNTGANMAVPGVPQPGVGTGFPFGAVASTNGVTRETLRAMLLLQDDMEQLWPLLSTLTGKTNASLNR